MEGDDIRRIVIEQSYRAGVGHIGSALCIADILATLFDAYARLGIVTDNYRPRLVLSKGHAALGLYAALHLKGLISKEVLDTYCGEGTSLGVHPERGGHGIDVSTGSLGMGLSIATGLALASKMYGASGGWPVICLLSDAEMNEGAIWEAAQFAAHHELDNLKVIVDVNEQQAFGKTWQVLRQGKLRKRWRDFGWHARWADGHDRLDLARKLRAADPRPDRPRPHIVLARTTFGKGVSFMENRIAWHYLGMDKKQYQQALEEVTPS